VQPCLLPHHTAVPCEQLSLLDLVFFNDGTISTPGCHADVQWLQGMCETSLAGHCRVEFSIKPDVENAAVVQLSVGGDRH